jgi:hypothetical protein
MIEKLLIISLWVTGYCCTFWEGMVFEKIGNWLDERLPEWLCKPLFQCFICAAFWWGTAIYWLFLGSAWKEWFLVVIGAMGLNAVFSKLFRDD